jgi:predicted Rossmann fold nucleotide-binding protein DprA/Smf involved in DNA uptake
MAGIEHDQRLAGFRFAEKLDLLAAEAPDVLTEKAVHQVAQRIRNRYAYTPRLRKAEIFARIRRGAASIAELVDETGFHKDEVYELTKELEAEGQVRFDRAPAIGRGRPPIRIFAATIANFSPPKT